MTKYCVAVFKDVMANGLKRPGPTILIHHPSAINFFFPEFFVIVYIAIMLYSEKRPNVYNFFKNGSYTF